MAERDPDPSTSDSLLAGLPTVPLLAVARLLNKDDRRSLSHCTRRFRELIWESEDKTLDCRFEYNSLHIHVKDSDISRGQIKIGICPSYKCAEYRYISLGELDDVLADIHTNWNYVFREFSPTISLYFDARHITSTDFKRTVEIVGRFKVFKRSPSSNFVEGPDGRNENEPGIRMCVSSDNPPRNVYNSRIASMVLSNSLIRNCDMIQLPELYRETIRLCKLRGIGTNTEEAFRKNDHYVSKSLDEHGKLCVTFM